MQILKSDSIKLFLMARTHIDLAERYHKGMEVQVNAARDGGDKITKEYNGKKYFVYSDGITEWKPFRIPLGSSNDPTDNDGLMTWDLDEHCEGIGLTGWNWQDKVSCWVGFDFDSIITHATTGITQEEMEDVRKAAFDLPYLTIRKSTSGSGLHVEVQLPNMSTENHNEHAALARAVLGKMCVDTGYDFSSKIDACGGNMWCWHRKMIGTDGLKLIKKGEVLLDIPNNWKDHIEVVTGKRRKIKPFFAKDEKEEMTFEKLMEEKSNYSLDKEHRSLIDYLHSINANAWWDADHNMLIAHTYDLMRAHEELGYKGIFQTISKGTQQGADHNCFMFPIRNGGWSIRRYTKGIKESDTWDQDSNGWTRCYYNIDPDLRTVALAFEAVEDDNKRFEFKEAMVAAEAAAKLGAHVLLPAGTGDRAATLREHKDGRLIIEVERRDTDQGWKGWLPKKNKWQKIFNVNTKGQIELETEAYDDIVRHLVTTNNENYGWVFNNGNGWLVEPLEHIRLGLEGIGVNKPKVQYILGSAVNKPWIIESRPFQPEYPAKRVWNRNAAQLVYAPLDDPNDLYHPTWDSILEHCGNSLNDVVRSDAWCKENGISDGSDYLRLWCASLFKRPTVPLPYLFFWGPENTGKSSFHEALKVLITDNGYARADTALINDQGFNGELEGAVLCVVEETNLKVNKAAGTRIKDWVTGIDMSIHRKNKTVYRVPNTTKWVQAANDPNFCPVTIGDTRIVVVQVGEITNSIPKHILHERLRKEAPDFITGIFNMSLPDIYDRLSIKVLETADKIQMGKDNQSSVEDFLEEHCHFTPGYTVSMADLWEYFLIKGDNEGYTKKKFGKEVPKTKYPKGRAPGGLDIGKAGEWYWGNISLEYKESKRPLLVTHNDYLVYKKEDAE